MKLWHWLQRLVCNQIRSHGVWFGKRAVVGAVRVFEPTLGYVFYSKISGLVWIDMMHPVSLENPENPV